MQIRKRLRDGFTLIEVLVVVAIIALLVSILLPSLQQAREHAKRAACAGQMHHLAIGLHAYAAAQKDGAYPYGLPWPTSPFGPPPIGALNPWMTYNKWNDTSQARKGYPAYIAIYKQKYVPEPKAFYCPANETLVKGGTYTWPKEPPTVTEALAIGYDAYRNYMIGYSWFADLWMSKEAYLPNRKSAWRNSIPISDYSDNWYAQALGRRYGKRQRIADKMSDPSNTLLVADIMQDMRNYKQALGTDQNIAAWWGGDYYRPGFSFNSHGGPYRFWGGNVGYNDGSITWRTREMVEADLRRSFLQNNGYTTKGYPEFQYMMITRYLDVRSGKELSFNLYW